MDKHIKTARKNLEKRDLTQRSSKFIPKATCFKCGGDLTTDGENYFCEQCGWRTEVKFSKAGWFQKFLLKIMDPRNNEDEWKEKLKKEQYRVLRKKG